MFPGNLNLYLTSVQTVTLRATVIRSWHDENTAHQFLTDIFRRPKKINPRANITNHPTKNAKQMSPMRKRGGYNATLVRVNTPKAPHNAFFRTKSRKSANANHIPEQHVPIQRSSVQGRKYGPTPPFHPSSPSPFAGVTGKSSSSSLLLE